MDEPTARRASRRRVPALVALVIGSAACGSAWAQEQRARAMLPGPAPIASRDAPVVRRTAQGTVLELPGGETRLVRDRPGGLVRARSSGPAPAGGDALAETAAGAESSAFGIPDGLADAPAEQRSEERSLASSWRDRDPIAEGYQPTSTLNARMGVRERVPESRPAYQPLGTLNERMGVPSDRSGFSGSPYQSNTTLNDRMGAQPIPGNVTASGYQPSSTLNDRLNRGRSPFATGYQPSGSFNQRSGRESGAFGLSASALEASERGRQSRAASEPGDQLGDR